MKIALIPFNYTPEKMAGTEIYTGILARAFSVKGHEAVVIAPGVSDRISQTDGYVIEEFNPDFIDEKTEDFYNLIQSKKTSYRGESRIVSIIRKHRPNLVNLFSFSKTMTVEDIRKVRSLGIPVVFTYITPTSSCPNGTLVKYGREQCSGDLSSSPCAPCVLRAKGIPSAASFLICALPLFRLSRFAEGTPLATCLKMPTLVRQLKESYKELYRESDRIIVLSEWARKLLILNGVPENKIIRSDHAVEPATLSLKHLSDDTKCQSLRVGFFGRCTPDKGLDILIEALRKCPKLNIRLSAYLIHSGDPDSDPYMKQMSAAAERDGRIEILDRVDYRQLEAELGKLDLLAVPSRWLEVGPLIVLHAFNSGVPVAGADMGGISELVRHNIDGYLLKNNSPEAWADLFSEIVRDSNLITKWKEAIRSPKTGEDVATELLQSFDEILKGIA